MFRDFVLYIILGQPFLLRERTKIVTVMQAQNNKRDAERQLRNATKEVERLQSAIKNYEEKVSNQGFWSGLLNKGQNATHSKELELEHKIATENEKMVKNDYNEKSSRVSNLETELREVQKAYANSTLGRELKRLTEERQARELEEQRQKEEQERKEREAQQQQVEETPKAEDVPQQYQAPRICMR